MSIGKPSRLQLCAWISTPIQVEAAATPVGSATNTLDGRNLHWCVEAELIRLVGYRKRENTTKDSHDVRLLIYELREQSRRVSGEQIMESKTGGDG